MADKKTRLIQFVRETKWEDYISDQVVIENLEKIENRIQQLGKTRTQSNADGKTQPEEVDVSGAIRIKLVVVGDGAVGKTSLLIRASTEKFPTEYLPTVFENYTMQMKHGKNNDTVLLHLWDTAGQEEYDRLRPLSYPRSDVILLCFSTISQVSFESVKQKWWPEVHHYIANVPHILIGTKIDLRELNTPDAHTGKVNPVSQEQAQSLAKEIGCVKYMEICSKDGRGIREVLDEAIQQVLVARGEKTGSGEEATPEANKKKTKKEKEKGGCVLI